MAPKADISNPTKMARRHGNYRVSKKTQEKAIKRAAGIPKQFQEKNKPPREPSSNGQKHNGTSSASSVASRSSSPRAVMRERHARQRLQALLTRYVDLILAGPETWRIEASSMSPDVSPVEATGIIPIESPVEVAEPVPAPSPAPVPALVSASLPAPVSAPIPASAPAEAAQGASTETPQGAETGPTPALPTDHEKRRRIVENISNERTMNQVPRGLVNVGNSCFRNAVLQSMLFIPRVMNWLEKVNFEYLAQSPDEMSPMAPLACDLYQLGEAIWGKDSTDTTSAVMDVHEATDPRINKVEHTWVGTKEQACAQEYLVEVIDLLLRDSTETSPNLFDDDDQQTVLGLFYKHFAYTWTCRLCSAVSRSNEGDNIGFQMRTKKGTNYLEQMFDGECNNVTTDHRCETCPPQSKCAEVPPCIDDQTCPHPKVLVNAPAEDRLRIGTIVTAPEVLFFHLVRFIYRQVGNQMRTLKTNDKVVYPLYLDLSRYADDPNRRQQGNFRYRLSSVVAHKGSLNGGHYIAYLRNVDGDVYEANDTVITRVNEQVMLSPGHGFVPYLLTYVLSPLVPTFPSEDTQEDT